MNTLKMMLKNMLVTTLLLLITATPVYANGWEQRSDGWYYVEFDGSLSTGFRKIDGYEYLFDENGKRYEAGVHNYNEMAIVVNADGDVYAQIPLDKPGMDKDLLFESISVLYKNWYYLNQVREDINGYRKLLGKSSYTELDFDLSLLATYRSLQLSKNPEMANQDENGFLYSDLNANAYLGRQGISLDQNVASTNLYGKETKLSSRAIESMKRMNVDFLCSASHYEKLFEENNKLGLGYVIGTKNGQDVIYYTQLFD